MFAPKRTKSRIEIQIFEKTVWRAFGNEKGPGCTAEALIKIQLGVDGALAAQRFDQRLAEAGR